MPLILAVWPRARYSATVTEEKVKIPTSSSCYEDRIMHIQSNTMPGVISCEEMWAAVMTVAVITKTTVRMVITVQNRF